VVRRLAADDDIAAAGDVVRAGYFALGGYPHDEAYDHEIGDIASRLDVTEVIVAELHGRIVGCVTYIADAHNPFAEHGDTGAATFRYFGVDPAVQGVGIGTAMVSYVIERARADGKERIRMHTLTMMRSAMRLYERFGFRRDPAFDGNWDGIIGLAYVLPL
jgi:GNAT superfamily N-acetyltransferase